MIKSSDLGKRSAVPVTEHGVKGKESKEEEEAYDERDE
jgi:hypothetical protein